jgi:hypothetical protein
MHADLIELIGSSIEKLSQSKVHLVYMKFRFVLFASKFMAHARNVASVPLISMPCVHRGRGIAWRYVCNNYKGICHFI